MTLHKNWLFVFFSLLNIGALYCQPPNIEWQKTFGGSANEEAYSILSTADSGILILGYTASMNGDVSHLVGSDDFWLLKISKQGNLEWNKCFGGSSIDNGASLIKTFDTGYIMTGYTSSNNGDVSGLHGVNARSDFWVTKIDTSETIQWQRCFGGSETDKAKEIIQLSDSGYFVIGNTQSSDGDVVGLHWSDDILVVKLNKYGFKQWAKALGGSSFEFGYSCAQTSNGDLLVVGSTMSNDGDVTGLHGNSQDVWVVKLNLSGQIIWQKCYGGMNGEFPNKILISNDGGFYISASTTSNDSDVSGNHGQLDYWLFKADSSGMIQWQKCFGGMFFEQSNSINKTSDGGFVIGGVATINDGIVSGTHGFDDFFLIKIDSLGNYEWSKCLGGSFQDDAFAVTEALDGGFVIAGTTESNDGDITLNHGNKDIWVVKLSPSPVSITELENSLMDLNISQNNDQLILRFFSKQNDKAQMFMYDVNGQKIFEKNLAITEGINYNFVNCANFSKGLYFVSLIGNKGSQRSKIVIQ
jgi:hypothetical protein